MSYCKARLLPPHTVSYLYPELPATNTPHNTTHTACMTHILSRSLSLSHTLFLSLFLSDRTSHRFLFIPRAACNQHSAQHDTHCLHDTYSLSLSLSLTHSLSLSLSLRSYLTPFPIYTQSCLQPTLRTTRHTLPA